MALVARTDSPRDIDSTIQDENFDITTNLKTLRIESSIPESKRCYMKLRARTHMLQSAACAQISFFVSVLSYARRIRGDLHTDGRSLGLRKLLGEETKDQLKVGIIGGGRLGKRIARCLLTYGGLRPKDIVISTRRPDSLEELKERHVEVIYNNLHLVQNCHLVVLCVLPSQLTDIVDEIKGHISKDCIIYNLVAATPLRKLKHVLRHNHIIIPQYSWKDENEDNKWDFQQEVENIFNRPDMIELICPLSEKAKNSVIQTNEKWVELIMYGVVNHCSQMGLKSLQVMQILNRLMLGITDTNPGLLFLESDDFTKQPLESDEQMPIFDLINVASTESPLSRKVASEKIRTAFTEQYVNVLQQYNLRLKFDPLHKS